MAASGIMVMLLSLRLIFYRFEQEFKLGNCVRPVESRINAFKLTIDLN